MSAFATTVAAPAAGSPRRRAVPSLPASPPTPPPQVVRRHKRRRRRRCFEEEVDDDDAAEDFDDDGGGGGGGGCGGGGSRVSVSNLSSSSSSSDSEDPPSSSSSSSLDELSQPAYSYFLSSLPTRPQATTREPLLPAKHHTAPRHTLVLDLDETLVHCSLDACEDGVQQFALVFEGVSHQVNMRRRPGVEQFLSRVAELFELVIFTASQRIYAEKVLDLIDPDKKLVAATHRLFRESCVEVDGSA
jgi:TFIIF-interacting CTD phosphatase-like protein